MSRIPFLDRFWEKVNKDASNGCWEWTAYKKADGYGVLTVDGLAATAHRLSWVIHNGKITDGLCVLHHCDNPPCVNPEHLFLGTKYDNMQDMIKKGRKRVAFGSGSGMSKLNEKSVKKIRKLYAAGGVGFMALGRQFGVNKSTIRNVVRRTGWKHVY